MQYNLFHLIQLKSNKEFIENWLESNSFFKHLECLLVFNNSNNEDINDQMSNYLQELSELEYNVSQSIFDDMYMIGLIAIFKKYP